MVEDANTKMLLNHKINLRIPRASNLVDLKLLLISSQEKQKKSELLSIEKFKKENYLEEYLKLLRLRPFILFSLTDFISFSPCINVNWNRSCINNNISSTLFMSI